MARSASNDSFARTRVEGTQTPKIHWDTSNVKTTYANVCDVTNTREEVVLNFGANKAWGRDLQELELTNRLILRPFAGQCSCWAS